MNFEYDGFTFYELHRFEKKQTCTRNSGGVIFYVRNELVSEDILFLKSKDSHLWLKINKNILVLRMTFTYACVTYRQLILVGKAL